MFSSFLIEKGRKAKDFLDGQSWWEPRPFFMMLSTPSCHAPFTPAPQYKGHFSNQSAPRGGSFGVYGKVRFNLNPSGAS